MTERVGEVAVEREHDILRERVDTEMKALHGLLTPGDAFERLFELSEVPHLDHHMEIAQPRRAKPKLPAGETPGLDQASSRRGARCSTRLQV